MIEQLKAWLAEYIKETLSEPWSRDDDADWRMQKADTLEEILDKIQQLEEKKHESI